MPERSTTAYAAARRPAARRVPLIALRRVPIHRFACPAPPATARSAVAVPCLELIIPRARLAELFEDLLAAHVQHLRLSIEAGPPTHLNKDHPGLRRYLLDQADLLESR